MPYVNCFKPSTYSIDSNGEYRASHTVDPDFNVFKFINFVKEKYRISWKEMYWKVVGFSYYAPC